MARSSTAAPGHNRSSFHQEAGSESGLSFLCATVTTPAYTDHNAILNGVTLEDLGTAPVAPRITGVSFQGGVAVTFESVTGRSYVLEYKAQLSDATWQTAGAITATGAGSTVRDDVAGHRPGIAPGRLASGA